ncbi:hypothetical protein DPMN_098953 [Dreissena polymorpha]|uniref:Uncharacterized protein n=1 Tax=Dreissena polymorpha TaxID=45954 RepID=A0A9D4R777_DREPO|nr:hypothetical protein DPMN_098953 [Dreissena polymorpha]
MALGSLVLVKVLKAVCLFTAARGNRVVNVVTLPIFPLLFGLFHLIKQGRYAELASHYLVEEEQARGMDPGSGHHHTKQGQL